MRQLDRFRPQLRQEIVGVVIEFEVVPSAVRLNAAVEDVDLTDTPAVEPCLLEDFVEHAFPSNLNVANPCTKAADTEARRYAASVLMVRYPSDGGNLAVYVSEFEKLDLIQLQFKKVAWERRDVRVGAQHTLALDGQIHNPNVDPVIS